MGSNYDRHPINLNAQVTLKTAPVRIDEAISIFGNCGIAEYEEFHLLLVNWRDEIINSFTVVDGRRINNSFMESKNRLVANNANVFKNFKRTCNRILYFLNPCDTFKF